MHSNRRPSIGRRVVLVAVCAVLILILAVTAASAKTTTWTNASPATDLWSDPGNWDNGVPSLDDVVLFDPVGGTSTMDIPGLGLGTMDMTGYTGELTLLQPLAVAGDLTVAGALFASFNTIDVGGSLIADGDLLADNAQVSVGMDFTTSALVVGYGATIEVWGSVNVVAGLLDMGDGSLEVKGDLTVDSGAGSQWTAPGGTLQFTGAGTQTWSDSGSSNYGNVVVNPGGSLAATGAVQGDRVVIPETDPPRTIDGELSVFGGTIDIRVDVLVGSGAFVANGAAAEVPPTASNPTLDFIGPLFVEGSFSMTSAGGTLKFSAGPGGTVTAGPGSVFEVIGSPGNLIRLEQDGIAGGSQWILDHDATATLTFDYVDVQDSDASAGNTVIATNSNDDGNNDNWDFGGAHTITGWIGGGVTDNWSEPGNWDHHVPVAGDTVLFYPVGGSSHMDIAGLTLGRMDMTGYTGTLDLQYPLDITGGAVIDGTGFDCAGLGLVVGGDLEVNGPLTLGGGICAVGGGLVVSAPLDAGPAGIIDVYGTVSAFPGAALSVGDGRLIARADVDFQDFSYVSWSPGGVLEVRPTGHTTFDFAGVTELEDLFITFPLDSLRLGVSSAADSLVCHGDLTVEKGTLELDLDVTVEGTTGLEIGGAIKGKYNPGTAIDLTGSITLRPPFQYKKGKVTVTLSDARIGGLLKVRGDSARVRVTPGDTVHVEPGGEFNVSADSANHRAEIVLAGAPGSARWVLDLRPGAITNFQNVRVQDSDATPGETAHATGNSHDAGNNDNWTFTFTGVEETPPLQLAARAVPNPFNPHTTVHYTVPRAGPVTIRVYDVAGRRIATLVSGVRAAGPHTVDWDGRDHRGGRAGSGVYFCRLQADGASVVTKMVLLR